MTRLALLPTRTLGLSLYAVIAFLAACDDLTVAPSANELGLPETESAKLLVCPTNQERSATALLTPLGGVLSVGGHRLDVPLGALQLPVLVTLTEPASQVMEISVRVAGSDFFVFELPVTVTISYERCGRNNIEREPLQAWHIDEVTKALLENMGGFDDKLARTVRFQTGHFSGYALAQ